MQKAVLQTAIVQGNTKMKFLKPCGVSMIWINARPAMQFVSKYIDLNGLRKVHSV